MTTTSGSPTTNNTMKTTHGTSRSPTFPLSRFLTYGLLLLLAAAPLRAADDVTTALQKGLFEEEANQNLDAAIKAYQSVLERHDEQRKLASTALFRLGECYRKLGKTNDAVAQYQRLLRDFSDQSTLVTLSRQNLTGIGAGSDQPSLTNSPGLSPFNERLTGLAGRLATSEEESEVRRIRALIKDSPDLINARDSDGSTPLHHAASKGQLKVAEFLLANGADVNAPAFIGNSGASAASGSTPLLFAARNGHKSMVELLLAKGASVQGNGSYTPLHAAASKGFKTVVEVLLDKKADVNARGPYPEFTPLHEAAQRGFLGVAQTLIARGADVNARCSSPSSGEHFNNSRRKPDASGSVLHIAVGRGDKALVDLLLTNKANPNLRSVYGQTPLHVAAYLGFIPIAEALLSAGADINANMSSDGSGSQAIYYAPLHLAVVAGRLEMLQFLLEKGADANRLYAFDSSNKDITALQQAASERPKDYLAMMRSLLEHKANPNLAHRNGYAPIHYAMVNKDQATLELLLKHGADANLAQAAGSTALNYARSPKEMFELLLANKANPNAQDKDGNAPLHAIVLRCQQGEAAPDALPPAAPAVLAKLLLDHGADPNLRNAGGRTPLNLFGVPATPASPQGVEVADLLRKTGARDEMLEPEPDPRSVRVWRKGRPAARVVFIRDREGRNQFTLFETIWNFYKLSTTPLAKAPAPITSNPLPAALRGGIPSGATMAGSQFKPADDLPFPDFTRVRIVRVVDAAKNEKKFIDVNLLKADRTFDCAKDMLLEFGDVVEIPEREYTLNEVRVGLTGADDTAFANCLPRHIKWVVKGQPIETTFYPASMGLWLRSTLGFGSVRAALRSSSDLTRLRVKRGDPVTKEAREFVIDSEASARSGQGQFEDLWLRDGDVIEVPDKESSPTSSQSFYIEGQVVKPGAYPMAQDEKMTVVQAIALAGGMTKLGAGTRVKIARTEGGRKFMLEVNATRSPKSDEPPTLIKPGDVITVPEKIF